MTQEELTKINVEMNLKPDNLDHPQGHLNHLKTQLKLKNVKDLSRNLRQPYSNLTQINPIGHNLQSAPKKIILIES